MIIDKVNEALETYARVTELNEKHWDDQKTIADLNEAYELDDTGLTVFMLLQGFTDYFTKNTKFKAADILRDPEAFAARMRDIKHLDTIVKSEEVEKLIAEFIAKVTENAHKYGISEESIERIPEVLFGGEIRRDAMRSLERLEAHQFLQGKPETDKLFLNKFVWEFWNINSLVLALRDQPLPGITLTLIRDPQEGLNSFFVFGIKNGENVTILTDRDKEPHPLYGGQSRRPDRNMSERANKNWFPYGLLKLEPIMGEDIFGREVVTGYKAAKQDEGLVRYNTTGLRIYETKNLSAEEFLWLILTAEKIDERYGKQNLQLPTLSYTGEMVVHPHALAAPEGSLVKSGVYRPLEVKKVSQRDITSASTVDNWGSTYNGEWYANEQTGFNQWIEDRYIDQVPTTILNSIGDGAKDLLKLEKSVGIIPDKHDSWRGDPKPMMTSFSPIVFGTEAAIRQDVQWHARHNQCVYFDFLAQKEFDKTYEALVKWWRRGIFARQEELINAAASQNFPTVSRRYVQFASSPPKDAAVDEGYEDGKSAYRQEVNLAAKIYSDPYYKAHFTTKNEVVYIGDKHAEHKTSWGKVIDRSQRVCCVNGKTPTKFVIMNPDNPTALADMLGIDEKDLPWQMQHWYKDAPYYGNNLLNRIDPLEWAVDNPWMKLRFSVVVSFSTSGLNARRKQLGLPKFEGSISCQQCDNGRNENRLPCKKCGRL